MRRTSGWALGAAYLVLTGLVLALYRGTFASIVDKWLGDSSFSHGLLVAPICLWLVWRKRAEIAAARWRVDWIGIVVLLMAGGAWFVARATGVLVVEQYAAVTMLSATVLAVLGREVARVLAFPLIFMLFAVPAGRGITPWLMQNTADIAAAALRWSGVPVVRDGMILSIPGGDFEVARACSGLNYLITGFTLGALYAYLTYTSARKRLLFMAASIVVPIVLNGVRAYLIIAVAHLTDMRWGPGEEHVLFGRMLFLATMLLLFWVGRRWRDPQQRPATLSAPGPAGTGIALHDALGVLAATVSVLLPVLHLGSALAHARNDVRSQAVRIQLPGPAPRWEGPVEDAYSWRPQYHGAAAERAATYTFGTDGPAVDIYVAVYGLGVSSGAEMISFDNRMSDREHGSLLPQRDVTLSLDGEQLPVHEILVPVAGGSRIAWRWYMVDTRALRSAVAVKAAEALAILRGGDASERVMVISTEVHGDVEAARERLHRFTELNAACVRSGFSPDGCGR